MFPHIGMHDFMLVEPVNRLERFVARLTSVRLKGQMNLLVIVEVDQGSKPFPANVAGEGFVFGMRIGMFVKLLLGVEAFLARSTREGLFAYVAQFVRA